MTDDRQIRVLFWVQHLLGTGHLKRALTLAQAMVGRSMVVTLVSGGEPTPWLDRPGLDIRQLPLVRARDLAFSALVDSNGEVVDPAFWARRRDQLIALLDERRPDCVVTEMFPFGRRAFRAELLPLLDAAAALDPPALRMASVRDILVQKPSVEPYDWMRDVVRAHYDQVFVHTDPAVVPFSLTFPHVRDIEDRLLTTGYVVGSAPTAASSEGEGEVVISAGGGRVGDALLRAALPARPLSTLASEKRWRLIAGGRLEESAFRDLRAEAEKGGGVTVERTHPDFRTLLANSLLSVSQAGYNTIVEALQSGKPMVLVPFATPTETEQRTRAERLQALGLAEMVPPEELSPASLAQAVDRALLARPAGPHQHQGIDLGGAGATAVLIERLVRERRG